ncbi:MAG: histone deacetylase [Chloroflexota bacterium]|nr:histone deacetylase [Chloroflexota bacterium]
MPAAGRLCTVDAPIGFLYDPAFLDHDTGEHVENGARMAATMSLLEESGLLARVRRVAAPAASDDDLALVHDRRYVEAVRRAAQAGGAWADPDTLITPRSFDVAARVVGGTLAALDAVLARDVESAFCLVRPPGHHATPVQAMGFCLFNHVAVAAAHARQRRGIERVAIVDIDVHHGNGTQDAFYGDPSVLYISTHEYPFYPGSGAATESGAGAGQGFTINVPLPAGCGDAAYARVFDEVVLPALRRFRPGLLLVSAGFDAHFADPLANERLSVDGYGALAGRLIAAARELCGGRLLLALEGGYDLVALPWCVRRTVELLLGGEPAPDPLGAVPARPASDLDGLIAEVRRIHAL